MDHKFIEQIEPGMEIDDIYVINDPILRSTSRGDLYIAMYIGDRTGQLNGRMWQASEAVYNSLPNPGFVNIQGRSEIYRDKIQIVVNSIKAVDAKTVSLADFLPRTEKDVEMMFTELQQILKTLKNEQLKALVSQFLDDSQLMEKFRNVPAAVKIHHNCIGGLLEHTHNMLKMAMAILPLYPDLQRDLVLAAIFLHDIGKTEELCYDSAFSYTDSGQLIGHIAKGILMIHEKARLVREKGIVLQPQLLDSIDHIVLSHHGEYEFGSPKLPATAEAFMVNYIDNLDARLKQVTTLIESENTNSNWTGWQSSLQTRIYKGRIDDNC